MIIDSSISWGLHIFEQQVVEFSCKFILNISIAAEATGILILLPMTR